MFGSPYIKCYQEGLRVKVLTDFQLHMLLL